MKKSKGAKNPNNAKRRKPKGRGKPTLRGESVEEGLHGHLKMVMDPCASLLTQSAYAGQRGIVQRFSSTWGVNTGLDNSVVYGFSPGGMREFFFQGSNATLFTPTFTQSTNMPGIGFLNSNASQARCVSACIRLNWSGSELNRSGSLAIGTVSGGQINTLPVLSNSCDRIYNMLQKKMRVPDGVVEIKWNPSTPDEVYQEPALTASAENFNDKTMMVFCSIGLPAATFTVTTTVIYEWVPTNNVGQPAPPTTATTVPAAVPKINNLLHKIHSGADTFNTSVTDAATAMSAMYAAGANGYKLITGARAMLTAATIL